MLHLHHRRLAQAVAPPPPLPLLLSLPRLCCCSRLTPARPPRQCVRAQQQQQQQNGDDQGQPQQRRRRLSRPVNDGAGDPSGDGARQQQRQRRKRQQQAAESPPETAAAAAAVGRIEESQQQIALHNSSSSNSKLRSSSTKTLVASNGGGYLSAGVGDGGDDAGDDEWTWDDDYNRAALARAARAARAPPQSPRAALLATRAAEAGAAPPTVVTRLPFHLSREVAANGVVLVDKPAKWSASDAAAAVGRALRAPRVGHAGALDDSATGLLIVLLGAATRLTPRFEPLPRTYSGTIQLGAATDTHDSHGAVTARLPFDHVTDADLAAATAALTGEIQQAPYAFGAAKAAGRPLRWYAERGEAPPAALQAAALAPRCVTIESFAVWRDAAGSSSSSSRDGGVVRFRVVASKGASVRVLAHDLGASLGCGAHLVELRREAVGRFSVASAWTLDVLLPLARRHRGGFR